MRDDASAEPQEPEELQSEEPNTPASDPGASSLPTPQPLHSPNALEEKDAPQLLQLLAEDLKRRQVEILSVRSAPGGFFVITTTDGQPNEQWFPLSEIRSFRRSTPTEEHAENT